MAQVASANAQWSERKLHLLLTPEGGARSIGPLVSLVQMEKPVHSPIGVILNCKHTSSKERDKNIPRSLSHSTKQIRFHTTNLRAKIYKAMSNDD